jgi:hypothetical protein
MVTVMGLPFVENEGIILIEVRTTTNTDFCQAKVQDPEMPRHDILPSFLRAWA